MKKIVLVTLVLTTLIFGLASCGDNSAAVGGSDKLLLVGKWTLPGSDYREYKSDGTWWVADNCIGTYSFETYEGRSVFIEVTNPIGSIPYQITWVYDYEFKNGGNEFHLRWLRNAGSDKSEPIVKNKILTRMK